MFGRPLDAYTLIVSMSSLAFVLAAFTAISARSMVAYRPALITWSKAMVAAGIGFYLLQMRHHWPLFATSFIANALVMSVAAFGLAAHARVLGVRIHRAVYVLPLTLGMAGIVGVHVFGGPQSLIVSSVSAAMSMLFCASFVVVAREARTQWRLLCVACSVVMLLLSAALALRVYLVFFGVATDTTPTSHTPTQLAPFFLGLVYMLTGSLWILDTVHELQRQAAIDAARRDGLTGLFTRTAFFELAARQMAQQRTAQCAVVMVDIDHFKRINDTLGHAAGDTTLAHAARLISSSVRLSDLVGRYGGEEFCILLPDCSATVASELAERLVAQAAGQPVRLKDGTTARYTLSAGYVCAQVCSDACADASAGVIEQPAELLSVLMEQADQALYRAKREGRNRAVAAADSAADSRIAQPA